MEEKVLFILRGVPGCGKSTVAQEIAKKHFTATGDVICCADDYHMVDGEYKWKAENQGYAHKACQNKCEFLMKANSPRIIIANTNTTNKEMKPYAEMANFYGYTVFYLVVENRHGGKDAHNVPEDSLEAMASRLRGSIELR
jgi:predicted kinase